MTDLLTAHDRHDARPTMDFSMPRIDLADAPSTFTRTIVRIDCRYRLPGNPDRLQVVAMGGGLVVLRPALANGTLDRRPDKAVRLPLADAPQRLTPAA